MEARVISLNTVGALPEAPAPIYFPDGKWISIDHHDLTLMQMKFETKSQFWMGLMAVWTLLLRLKLQQWHCVYDILLIYLHVLIEQNH